MLFQRLSHTAICVSNLERSARFYCDVLGFQKIIQLDLKPSPPMDTLVELKEAHLQPLFIERDGVRLELIYFKTPGVETVPVKKSNQTGFTHLSFRVSNLDEAIKAIVAGGGTYLEHTRFANPAFGMYGCFVLDPDGVKIELLEAPGDPNLLPGQRPPKK